MHIHPSVEGRPFLRSAVRCAEAMPGQCFGRGKYGGRSIFQIPGHPGPGGRLGTKKDMEQQLAFKTNLSAEVKKAPDAGKCFDPATKEVRLPQHGTLTGCEQNIEWTVHRWRGYWGRGI